MANLASLIVKIGANDAEIQKSLEKLGASVKRTDADFKKIGNSPIAQQAQKSLESLNVTVKGITDSHQHLADRATAMGRAFTSGVITPARLTKTELDQVNRSLQAGLEAFRALGQRAPADLQKVAAAVQQQQKALAGASSAGGLLATTFGRLTAAFTLGNLLSRGISTLSAWTAEAFRSASTIVDLSQKTGLAMETIQRFSFVAGQTGTSVDAFTNAAFQLSTRIGGGSGSVVKAVEALGLSFRELRSLSPDELFAKVVKAAESVEDVQKRNTLLVALFGKSAGSILPAIAEGYSKIAAQAPITANAQITALDQAADRWDKFVSENIADLRGQLGDTILIAEKLRDALPQANPFTLIERLGTPPVIAPAVLQSPAGSDRSTTMRRPVFDLQQYRRELAEAQALVAGLTTAERAEIDAALDLDVVIGDLADKYGLTDAAIKLLEKAKTADSSASQKAAEAAKKHATAVQNVQDAIGSYGETLEGVDLLMQGLAQESLLAGASQADVAEFFGLTVGQVKKLAEQISVLDKIQALNNSTTLASASALEGLGRQIKATVDLTNEQIAVRQKLFKVEATKPLGFDLRSIGPDVGQEELNRLREHNKEIEKLTKFQKDLDELSQSFAQLAQVSGDSFDGLVQDLATVVVSWNLATKSAQQFRDATTNAGRAAALIGGVAAGAQATGQGSIGSRVLGGAATGAALGSIIPGVGTAVGAGVGALVGLFRGIAAGKKDLADLRAESQRLINAAGGINELAQRAFDAGTGISTLLSAMNSDNPEKLRAELTRLNAALEFQDQAMQTLDETVGRYNFTIEERGPAIALREQMKIAEQLLQDWRLLTAAGVDVAAVAREMAASTNLYVQNALKMGQEIPEFMRAQILKMIERGLLYDVNGQKITSLEGSGITFSQSMTANVDRIILKIQALIEAIDRGLGNVIRNVPDIVVDVRYNDPGYLPPNPANPGPREDPGSVYGAQGGRVTRFGIQQFAQGGRVLPFLRRGMDTVPAMLTPGEWVLTRAQQDAIGAALAGRDTPTILHAHLYMDGKEISHVVLNTLNSGGDVRSKFNSLVKKAG